MESAHIKALGKRFKLGKLSWDVLYPEYPLPYGERVDRTYWRRGTIEEFIPPNKYYLDKVIVFINYRKKSKSEFKEFYGQEPAQFAETIANSQIIPVIDIPAEYENVEWGKEFFKVLQDNGIIPIYSRRLEDILTAKTLNKEPEIGIFGKSVEDLKKEYKEVIKENTRNKWLNVMGQEPGEYLAERRKWMELLGWNSYFRLLMPDSPLLNEPKLAQDYAFHINYFTNVPYFYSKGGAVTVAPEDLPSMVDTMKKILSYFQQAHPISNKLNEIVRFIGDIVGRTKRILSKPIYKGNKAKDIKDFSKTSGKEEFQSERNGLTEKKVEIFQKRGDGILKSIKKKEPDPILDSDIEIENYLNEMQEILNNMGSIMKRELGLEKVKNAAIIIGSIAVSLSSPPHIPIQQPLNVACLVDFERSFSLFKVFKLKYKEIDCGPIVVYMQNKKVAEEQISRMIKIGAIVEQDGRNAKQMLYEVFK